MPTWMRHHKKSIKRGPCRPGVITSHRDEQRMHSTHQSTCGRDLDFGGTGGGCKSLVSLLSLVACCWWSQWEHFSSNKWRTVTDRLGTKMQLSSFTSVTVAIGGIIVFSSSTQPQPCFLRYTFQQLLTDLLSGSCCMVSVTEEILWTEGKRPQLHDEMLLNSPSQFSTRSFSSPGVHTKA